MASSAADACGLLRDKGLLFRESKDRVVVLDDGHPVGIDGTSHHGSAHEDLSGLRLVAAAEFDHVMDHRSDRNDDIARFSDRVSVDRHSL